MPCSSDHLEPTQREIESKRVCELLLHFKPTVPDWVREGAANCYGTIDQADKATILLCEFCEDAPDSIIYDGRDPMARKLADWWDAHQDADRRRKKRQARQRRTDIDAASGLAKLTDAEKKALGFITGK